MKRGIIAAVVLLIAGCAGQSIFSVVGEEIKSFWFPNTVSIVHGNEDLRELSCDIICVGTIIHSSEKGVYGITVNHALEFNPTHILMYGESPGFARIHIVTVDHGPLDMALFRVDMSAWPDEVPEFSTDFDPKMGFINTRVRGVPHAVDIVEWDRKPSGEINRFAARLAEPLEEGDSGSGVYSDDGKFYGMVRQYRTIDGDDPSMGLITSSQRIGALLDKVLNSGSGG